MKLYSEIAQDYGKAKFQSRKPIKKIITLKNIHENVNQVTKGGLLGTMLKKKKNQRVLQQYVYCFTEKQFVL